MNKIEDLKKIIFKKIDNKFQNIDENILQRINQELNAIEITNSQNYFIIFSKIVDICNELGILRSFGRGSAASSIINFILDITKINPIEHNLIFERFLNYEDFTSVDIDIDIEENKYQDFIEKLKKELIEFKINRLAYSTKEKNSAYLIYIKEKMYNIHPCAIIINFEKIDLNIKLGWSNNEEFIVTDDRTKDLPKIQKFKFDVLKLNYLDKLHEIYKKINKPEEHPYNITFNHPEVFNLLTYDNKENIFQSSADSIYKIYRDMKPSTIEDVAIINSTYRPLAIKNFPELMANKRTGLTCQIYEDRRINQLLKETYGVLIYQETFMILTNQLAGFSFNKADKYRKILFNQEKYQEKVEIFKEDFKDGCLKYSKLSVKSIDKFTAYILQQIPRAFQKSHALSYAMISYIGAYYKYYYPHYFYETFGEDKVPF